MFSVVDAASSLMRSGERQRLVVRELRGDQARAARFLIEKMFHRQLLSRAPRLVKRGHVSRLTRTSRSIVSDRSGVADEIALWASAGGRVAGGG